jgi:hypothetical protein
MLARMLPITFCVIAGLYSVKTRVFYFAGMMWLGDIVLLFHAAKDLIERNVD